MTPEPTPRRNDPEPVVSIPSDPATRSEDVPLHDDVRWLAAALGKVISRLDGPEVNLSRRSHLTTDDRAGIDVALVMPLVGLVVVAGVLIRTASRARRLVFGRRAGPA